jgi:hypothetical protein
MAAGWEREAPHHSTPIADESALIRWMAGCTGYIRDQVSGVVLNHTNGCKVMLSLKTQEVCVSVSAFLRRNALPTTLADEKLIARAAIIGERTSPYAG